MSVELRPASYHEQAQIQPGLLGTRQVATLSDNDVSPLLFSQRSIDWLRHNIWLLKCAKQEKGPQVTVWASLFPSAFA